MMIRKMLLILLTVVLAAGVCFADAQKEKKTSTEKKTTIVDYVGRTVEVSVPVKRIVVFNIFNVQYVRAIGGMDVIVGMPRRSAQIAEFWPGFDMNNIAGEGPQEPDYEKIVALKPDVLIIGPSGPWEEAEQKLKPFGIKVVTMNATDSQKHVLNVTNLGLMLDKSERAQELIDFYQKPIDMIKSRVKKLESKKKVYYESYGIAYDYKTCLAGSRWHSMIETAGGFNVFGDIIYADQPKQKGNTSAFEVDPEAILLRNPELVLKMEPGSKGIGITPTYYPCPQSEMQATWERLVSRPGWADLDAVKNNRVYVMDPFAANACSKMVGACYLAKWLYPDRFPDLDPGALMKEWLENFQGVTYPGSYVFIPE